MPAPRVLLTCRWPEDVEREVLFAYDADIIGLNKDRGDDKAAVAAWLKDYDYICPTITDRFGHDLLSRTELRTKALCNFGAGVNHIDLAACRAAGIVVTNTPDVLTDDTADIAIMLMLMAARRGGEGERLVRSRGWQGWTPTHLLGTSLAGKTLGLVGFGRIGQAMARKAHHAFDMRIIYHTRTARAPDELPWPADYHSLETLLSTADVVALHAPGGAATRHLIDAKRLALMKPGTILVNTARGDLIDEAALVEALVQRRIAAAGLDVFEFEPRVYPELLALDNVVLLPHLGSATRETRSAMGLRVLANLNALVAGDPPPIVSHDDA